MGESLTVVDVRGQLLKELACCLRDAEALEKFHHRHVDAQIRRDAIFQLDRHQRVQSQVGQWLLYIKLRGRKPSTRATCSVT